MNALTGYQKSEFCLEQGRKINDICLKQVQGMRGRAAPPHPSVYRVPPRQIFSMQICCTFVKTEE